MPIAIVDDIAAARAGVLARRPLGETAVSPEFAARLQQVFGRPLTPEEAVREVIAEVAAHGDEALRRYSALIEGVPLDDLRLPAEALRSAYEAIEPDLAAALELAAERVRAFHRKQPLSSWMDWDGDGALGQMVRPLQRVGIYVPGGTAPLASSLIMAAVPARVAGVPEVIVCTPPDRESGMPHPVVLAAAHVAGVDAVYRIGGAQAIAAMALGTESLPRVDKVVGPGNLLVVLAKKALFGVVGIESLPGPTETLIVADDSADPTLVAADLVAQAEHIQASAILVTPSRRLAERVAAELERRLPQVANRAAVEEALMQRGGIVVCRDLDEAMDLANEYAPEHLCLLTERPWDLVPRVRNAGGVFVGELASEALGDYVVGPSHIMPTGGTARFASPVNVWDFVKITSIFAPGRRAVAEISEAGARLAAAEGLSAHRDAILLRGGSQAERR